MVGRLVMGDGSEVTVRIGEGVPVVKVKEGSSWMKWMEWMKRDGCYAIRVRVKKDRPSHVPRACTVVPCIREKVFPCFHSSSCIQPSYQRRL